MARASGGRSWGRLAPVHVPEALSNGNKFIKWDDVSYAFYSISSFQLYEIRDENWQEM